MKNNKKEDNEFSVPYIVSHPFYIPRKNYKL